MRPICPIRPVPSTAFLLAAASPLAAASEPSATSDLAAGVVQMLFGLGIVIALLLACLWAIKRLSAPRGNMAALKVLGAVPVGPRERVVLVALGGKVLALGVTQNSVNTLHVMSADELPDVLPATPAAPAGRQFADWFRQSLERSRNAR